MTILETERLIVRLPGNHASRRVLEKIGMQDQGIGDYAGTPVEVLVIDRQDHVIQ